MPSSTLDDLADAYSRVSAGNAAVFEQFHAFATLLEQAHIPFLVLKGLDVLVRCYGIRGTRPLSDIDLLVHETDLVSLDKILTAAGYSKQIDGNPCYASPGKGLAFDIVTRLWYLDDQSLAELWATARPHTLHPRRVSLLAADDLLIHLIAYAVIHRGAFTPGWEQDIRLLLSREALEWTAVTRKARQYSLSIPLLYGLTYLRHRMPTLPIPESFLQSLAPGGGSDRVLYWLLQRLVTTQPIPELGHFLIWLTRPAGSKWRDLRQTFLPSKTFLGYRYGAAATRTPLITRCRRLISLTWALLTLATAIVRRLLRSPMRSPA
ncbi:MAG: nucleotidyltransferase family protein [Nitrospira sp.]|nr:nucleotidyltransferase family protein [Nitrospira sp.]